MPLSESLLTTKALTGLRLSPRAEEDGRGDVEDRNTTPTVSLCSFPNVANHGMIGCDSFNVSEFLACGAGGVFCPSRCSPAHHGQKCCSRIDSVSQLWYRGVRCHPWVATGPNNGFIGVLAKRAWEPKD